MATPAFGGRVWQRLCVDCGVWQPLCVSGGVRERLCVGGVVWQGQGVESSVDYPCK